MKIKVRVDSPINMPKITPKGDWFDLFAADDVSFPGPRLNPGNNKIELTMKLVPLGIRMELPKGFEAIVLPRSSTPKNFGIVMSNSQGVIDQSYGGNDDEWKFGALAIRDITIIKGSKICQFKIQLSQKATFFQKLRWMCARKIQFVSVPELKGSNRGGFGTTGMTR